MPERNSQELEQQLISLAAKNDRLADALTTARRRLVELQDQLDQAMRAPPPTGCSPRHTTRNARRTCTWPAGRCDSP